MMWPPTQAATAPVHPVHSSTNDSTSPIARSAQEASFVFRIVFPSRSRPDNAHYSDRVRQPERFWPSPPRPDRSAPVSYIAPIVRAATPGTGRLAVGHETEDEASSGLAAPPAREAATMSAAQELPALLEAAVESLVIRGRGRLSSTEYSVASYAQALRDVRQRHTPDLRRALSGCEIEIRDQTASDNLLSFLRAALQDYIHDDRIQTAASVACGLWGGGQGLDLVAKKLLLLAVSLGTASTATLFTRSLNEPECRFQYLTLLGGVTVENPVEVYDGVRLALLSKNDAELPGYIPDVSVGDGVNRFRGGTVIAEDMLASPRYMNPQDHEEAGGTESFRVIPESAATEEFQPNEFCNALSLVAGARVFPSCSWKFISDDEPAKLSEPMSGGMWMDESRPQSRRVVTGEQIQQAKHLYESLTTMDI